MSRAPGERYADILAAIERCQRYRVRLSDADDEVRAMAYDAILRNLGVIGEAVRALPEDVKAKSPETPWASIAGLRNIVVHEYFRVDADMIAEIVNDELTPLARAIEQLSES